MIPSSAQPTDGDEATKMSSFFALIGRTQLISRWSLMRSLSPENVQEHSFQVAMIAQALVFIRRAYFPDSGLGPDPDHIVACALFHDVAEVMTGDLPTPVKYHDPELKDAYKRLELQATQRLLHLLPEAMRPYYAPYFQTTSEPSPEAQERMTFIKAADKLSALIKCQVEASQGNTEFEAAEGHLLSQIEALNMQEANYFMTYFLPSFTKNIDHYQL